MKKTYIQPCAEFSAMTTETMLATSYGVLNGDAVQNRLADNDDDENFFTSQQGPWDSWND